MYIIFGLLLLVAVLLVVIILRPATFSVARSQEINAPSAVIFAQVVDFHAWTGWSPWEQIDPNSKRTYGGSPATVGATYRWNGNAKVGEGLMTLTEVRPSEFIGITIEFFRPFAANNQIVFTFVATGDTTTVTWTMNGNNSFMGKAMSLVMDCERLIGGPFAQGLARLKAISEADRA